MKMKPAYHSTLWTVLSSLLILNTDLAHVRAANAEDCFNLTTVTFSEQDLVKTITKRYSADFRPKRNPLEPVVVHVLFGLSSILDFNLQDNLLIVVGYLETTWRDDFLIWNETFPYSCVERITIPANKVWIADLTITNSRDGSGRAFLDSSKRKVHLFSDGRVDFFPKGRFSVKCKLDLLYYPFDEQICSIQVGIPNYDPHQMVIKADNRYGKGRAFVGPKDRFVHPIWELLDYKDFITTEGEYKELSFRMRLKRRPLYYYINIVTPGLVIAAIELVIFALDIENVDKFAFAFTCLLAYTVFQSMIIGDIPKSSQVIPVIAIYIYIQMAYITIIIIAGQALVFLILGMTKVKSSKPPTFLVRLSSLSCPQKVKPHPATLRKSDGEDGSKVEEVTARDGPEQEKEATAPSEANTAEQRDENAEAEQQWLQLANFVNRLTMVVYIVAVVITPPIMFVAMPEAKDIDDPKYNSVY